MTAHEDFPGFDRGAVKFLADLAKHNNKEWFEEHKERYERLVREPSRDFVRAAGEPLKALAPLVHADPRVNRSLFRIYRDQRRVKEGPPFKTHLGIWFWEGPGHRMSCSGFYFHLDPDGVRLGCGMPFLRGELLHAYRRAAAHPVSGPALAQAVEEITSAGYELGGKTYKRMPKGYSADHPNAELLLHSGVWAWHQDGLAAEAFGPDCLGYCLEHWVAMLPLHQWLVEMTRKADAEAA